MVLHRELDLFYDTLLVCGCSKCKRFRVKPRHVTLTHYINDQINKFDSLIPPIAIKDPIGVIEKTCKNTCFQNFESN